MRVLVLGGTGMLGHKACQRLKCFDLWTICRSNREIIHNRTLQANALNFDQMKHAIRAIGPDVVVNCIGLIKQHTANNLDFIQLNAAFPHQLAKLCLNDDMRLIHISSDCVFSGNKGYYTEEDKTDPVDVYGTTKALGELGSPHLTIRTSIIGRELNTKYGLLEWFLSQKGRTVNGFRKCLYSGLTIGELCGIIEYAIEHPELQGLYNVAGPQVSKWGLLHEINIVYDVQADIVSTNNPWCDRTLNDDKFRAATQLLKKPWRQMIEEMYHDEV